MSGRKSKDETIEKRRRNLKHIHKASEIWHENLPNLVQGLIDDFEGSETRVQDRIRIVNVLAEQFVNRDQMKEDLGIRATLDGNAMAAGLMGLLAGFTAAQKMRFQALTADQREEIILQITKGQEAQAKATLEALPFDVAESSE